MKDEGYEHNMRMNIDIITCMCTKGSLLTKFIFAIYVSSGFFVCVQATVCVCFFFFMETDLCTVIAFQNFWL